MEHGVDLSRQLQKNRTFVMELDSSRPQVIKQLLQSVACLFTVHATVQEQSVQAGPMKVIEP